MIVLKIQTIAFPFPFPFTRRKFSIHKYLHWSCCFNYMQYPIGTWPFGEWPVDGVTMSSNSRQWTNLNFVSICAIANTTNTLHTYMFPLTNTCTHTQHTHNTHAHITSLGRVYAYVESSSNSCVRNFLLLPKYAISMVSFLVARERENSMGQES